MIQELFSGIERRAYVRFETSAPVRFKVAGTETGKIYAATSINMSHGGLCLEVRQDKEELMEKLDGAGIKLRIDLDTLVAQPHAGASDKPVWVDSTVDWMRKPNRKNPTLLMGLKFEDLSPEAHEKIHRYIVNEFIRRYEVPE